MQLFLTTENIHPAARAEMKRTLSQTGGIDAGGHPHAPLGSLYAGDSTRRHKQLYSSREDNTKQTQRWQPGELPEMSPLTDFLLSNEEAFHE